MDVVVRYGPKASLQELEACTASLPKERVTTTVVCPTASEPTIHAIRSDDVTEGRRRAAGGGRAPFILFIDADSTLSDGALDIALGHLAQGAGVVGGLLVTMDEVYAAGYAISISGRPYRRYQGWAPDSEKVQQLRADLQAVPFAFLATRREVFRAVGLRPEFGNRPYSDVDYCVRVRRAGALVVYEPAIRLQTSGLFQGPDDPAAIQLMLASAQPVYDEWAVL